ncbi:uncharacterized protein LOC133888027 [Phragmites australis]|uniref:uncharacterized protein LOC133888027 n=1 Tax=Phragmites australis TaxID=29695 RepID=UPI002D76C3EE|nr:uncharacterized protein LOC133888027 [Phragmites australis]
MASLHHRPTRGDLFRPSTAPDPAAAAAFPRHSTLGSPAHKNCFAREIYTTASPTPPPQQFALAPPLPPASGRRRAGGGMRGVRVCCFGDPEVKRRRRVAGYKAYAVEGKVKASLRRGLRWFKRKCSGVLHF